MMGEKEGQPGNWALLNQGQENEMEIFGYKTQIARRIACIAGHIFSLGFLLLLFYWKPEWEVWANCIACSLQDADVILLRTTDEFKNHSRKKVRWIHLSMLQSAPGEEQDYPIKADEDSIANRAIVRLGFKVRYIRVQKIRYVWDNVENKFSKIGALEDRYSCANIHRKFAPGLTKKEQDIRKLICGPNAIEVEIVPIWKLLFKEVLNPFYLFQAAAVGLWLALGYYEVSIAIIIMTLISVIVTVYDLRQQSVKLHELVETHNSVMVTVCLNNGDNQKVESRDLVPGDVIALMGQKLYLPCDALLIDGSCIVDEGMLTGESIPVTKMPLPTVDNSVPWKIYSGEDYKRHVLFCGTNVIQTKASDHGPGKAVVLQTGFNTAKGDLVRSILYPKPVNFKLHRDAFRFLMGLLAAGLVAMVYSIIVYVTKGQPTKDTVIMALLVITVAVPPALLAALAVGVMYAQRRLKKKGIFCISPQRINVCGQLNLVCFDKTGTLTEDGLDLWGIVPARANGFQEIHRFNSGEALPWGPLMGALASCHSLIITDGNLQGDPMDLKMFEGTHWEVEDTSANVEDTDGGSASSMTLKPGPKAGQVPVEGISIVHQFPFSSSLQRMSVVTRVIGENEVLAFMKGAPEKVISFCRPETVPSNFSSELQLYTAQGFRVIGLAYKALPPEMHSELKTLTREDVESNLEFLGLLVMENQLKPETKPVLMELMDARIRTVMVTGDNLQTALTVAKHSGLISEGSQAILVEASAPEDYKPASLTFTIADTKNKMDIIDDMHINIEGKCTHPLAMGNYHFAMEGKTYHLIMQHFYSLLPKLLINGVIFARMSPGLKSSLVEELQKLDYCVGMCGDGANDCGALKTAHAGISLSEQEASVASPFTSRMPNIECVTELIKEGRCALVTSFTVFKYMSLYALILLINLVLLYWSIKLLGKRQYLITDVAISTVVCLTINLNGAYPKLAPYRPPNQLMSPPLLLSIFLNTLFNFIIQVCGFITVQQQEWYSETNIHSVCVSGDPNLNATAAVNFETTTLFPLAEGNLVIVAFVFSKGKPFRKPMYTNYLFFPLILGLMAVSIFLIFANIPGVYIEMELVCTPTYWRVYLFVALVVVFIASWGLEDGVLENRAVWLRIKKLFNYKSSSQYRKLQRLLEKDTQWPPLNRTILADSAATETDVEHGTYCNAAYENEEKELANKEQNIQIPPALEADMNSKDFS